LGVLKFQRGPGGHENRVRNCLGVSPCKCVMSLKVHPSHWRVVPSASGTNRSDGRRRPRGLEDARALIHTATLNRDAHKFVVYTTVKSALVRSLHPHQTGLPPGSMIILHEKNKRVREYCSAVRGGAEVPTRLSWLASRYRVSMFGTLLVRVSACSTLCSKLDKIMCND